MSINSVRPKTFWFLGCFLFFIYWPNSEEPTLELFWYSALYGSASYFNASEMETCFLVFSFGRWRTSDCSTLREILSAFCSSVLFILLFYLWRNITQLDGVMACGESVDLYTLIYILCPVKHKTLDATVSLIWVNLWRSLTSAHITFFYWQSVLSGCFANAVRVYVHVREGIFVAFFLESWLYFLQTDEMKEIADTMEVL